MPRAPGSRKGVSVGDAIGVFGFAVGSRTF
jgi:hypothetical protein